MKPRGVVFTCANNLFRVLRISSISFSESGEFRNGVHQLGDLWKTKSSRAVLAISGINCTPVAPVPITPTRLPSKSIGVPPTPPLGSAGQRKVWNETPLNVSIPSISGILVAESRPTAVRRNVQVAELPSSSVTFQRLRV